MAVAMQDAAALHLRAFETLLKPLYWIFVSALALNAVYPAVLLHSKRRSLQRDAVAAIDVLLDIIYIFTFSLSMFTAGAFSHTVPTAPHLYVSILSPLVRVAMTAREIETAAIERLEQRRSEAAAAPGHSLQEDSLHVRAAVQQRLPAWAALCFLVLAGLACWAPFLFSSAGDHYPFSNGDKCRPCACSGELVLESCAIPARSG
jgi:hypothetical protein